MPKVNVQDWGDEASFGPCEVCGEPAPHAVNDVEEWPGEDGWMHYRRHGSVHLFCDTHNRPSMAIRLA